MGVKRKRDSVPLLSFWALRAWASRAARGRRLRPGYHALSRRQGCLRPRCAAATRSLTASLLGRDRSQANGQAGKAPGQAAPMGLRLARLAL